MMSLQTFSVVDQMTTELASRRRQTARRRAAYTSLARAILQADERQRRPLSPEISQRPRSDREFVSAA